MDSNWAGEHLQVIRTLMERSAIYRRTLAPIMLLLGILGLLAAARWFSVWSQGAPLSSTGPPSAWWLLRRLSDGSPAISQEAEPFGRRRPGA